jgi:hypothetical protein
MLQTSGDVIEKWRVEIDNAEQFRIDNLGEYEYLRREGAGNNIDYFEFGLPQKYVEESNELKLFTPINVIYPIVKNVIPTLYYKNPHINAIPKRPEDDVGSTHVSAILNYYYDELGLKEVNKQVVFDAFVLGMGISKIGYTTKFGSSPTEDTDKKEKKEREKSKLRKFSEQLGLMKPKEEEEVKQNPELDEFIRSESPFSYCVSPFNFGIDPAATSINNARFVYEKITKILSDVKSNKNYKNTKGLEGDFVQGTSSKNVPDTEIDAFKTVVLYEIHYKTDEGLNILVLAKEGDRYRALRHDKSVYKMDGFPYEVLSFNKHNHKLYPVSDIDIVKGLQDRINTTFETILDQVDRYDSKLFVKEAGLTKEGKNSLENGELGSVVYTQEDPANVVKEGSFVQLKGDLVALIDKTLEAVMLETGLTKAQLMGLTSAETATEAQIGQAGQNLRMSDKLDNVNEYSVRQSRKLWQVIQQFVDVEEMNLITGERELDPTTGQVRYTWLPDITPEINDRMLKGEYRFNIDIGSTEKPDLPILRKQVENLANILMGPGVMQAFQAQGFQINLAEILKSYMNLFPDVFKDASKIIQPIQQQPGAPGQPGAGGGAGPANRQQLQSNAPNKADIISSIGGEKGSIPLA